MPQVSKGDRLAITSRIPRAYEAKLKRYTEDTGEKRTDLVARLLCEFLDNYTPNRDRGELPMHPGG
jgi:hypothetical protein